VQAVFVVSATAFEHDVALWSQFVEQAHDGFAGNALVCFREFQVELHPELLQITEQ